ncbi:hypothetical protein ILYODFUR_022497 [Ilyodon furcidens]|uniref:Uncharacterized protein n=1 Tax=Ilyodon furcidens TaxID=33524 RepID=A0ABV0UU97_9TELE
MQIASLTPQPKSILQQERPTNVRKGRERWEVVGPLVALRWTGNLPRVYPTYLPMTAGDRHQPTHDPA